MKGLILIKVFSGNMATSTLFGNLVKGIINSQKSNYVLCIFMINIFNAVITGYITALNFSLMNSITSNKKSEVMRVLSLICLLNCINQLLSYFYVIIYQTKIVVDLTKFLKSHFMDILLMESNHDWLNCNKSSEIVTAINKGTNSLISTLKFLVDGLNPILQGLGSIIIVGTYVGWKTSFGVVIMCYVFYQGSSILIKEFYARANVNKEVNPLSTYNTHLAGTFLVALLNGKGNETKNQIISNSTKSDKLNSDITLSTRKSYKILEIFSLVTILGTVYLISDEEEVSNIIAINLALTSAVDKMWWLFFMINNVSQSASEWAVLETYLKSVVSEEKTIKRNLDIYDISEFEEVVLKREKEYQIVGDSGCGKSTWMMKEVIRLFRRYNVNWLYLDQRMIIPKSSCVSIFSFLTKYLKDSIYDPTYLKIEIFKWAKYLRIDNLINESTIEKSFDSPSGGEEKRVIILQKLLPILAFDQKVEVIFADEITAGLDDKSHLIVRNLLEKLKKDHGITIVNIDHHKYSSDLLQKVGINKLCTSEKVFYEKSISDENSHWLADFINYIGKRYSKEIIEKKIKYPPNVRLTKND